VKVIDLGEVSIGRSSNTLGKFSRKTETTNDSIDISLLSLMLLSEGRRPFPYTVSVRGLEEIIVIGITNEWHFSIPQ
jgi:hypothetical protein